MAKVELEIEGSKFFFEEGMTVASAILSSGSPGFRKSVAGDMRGPLCGMGVCFECRVKIDGNSHERSCQILVVEGMRIETDGEV